MARLGRVDPHHWARVPRRPLPPRRRPLGPTPATTGPPKTPLRRPPALRLGLGVGASQSGDLSGAPLQRPLRAGATLSPTSDVSAPGRASRVRGGQGVERTNRGSGRPWPKTSAAPPAPRPTTNQLRTKVGASRLVARRHKRRTPALFSRPYFLPSFPRPARAVCGLLGPLDVVPPLAPAPLPRPRLRRRLPRIPLLHPCSSLYLATPRRSLLYCLSTPDPLPPRPQAPVPLPAQRPPCGLYPQRADRARWPNLAEEQRVRPKRTGVADRWICRRLPRRQGRGRPVTRAAPPGKASRPATRTPTSLVETPSQSPRPPSRGQSQGPSPSGA